MIFSTAQISDAKKIVQFVNSAYRGEYSKKGWTTEADLLDGQRTDVEKISEMILEEHGTIEMLSINDQLVGCVYLKHEGDTTYLGMLTVEPTKQNAGLGRALMVHAEAWAREHMAKKIRMTVIQHRTELIAYYNRKGYVITGKTEPFPMEDPRFGLPKRTDLVFVELVKEL